MTESLAPIAIHPPPARKYKGATGITFGFYRCLCSTDVMRSIYQKEGLHGFYRVYFPAILTHMPATAAWWSTYNITKGFTYRSITVLEEYTDMFKGRNQAIPFKDQWTQIIAGGTAGFASALVQTPMEVAKTRLQLVEHGSAEYGKGFW